MKASALEVFLTLIHSTLQSNKSHSSQIKRSVEESSSLLTCTNDFLSFFCFEISHKCENKIEKVIFCHLGYPFFSKGNLLAKFLTKREI